MITDNLKDCRGRDLADVLFYVGHEHVIAIDEDKLRNHKFMSKEKCKVPKGGTYMSAAEFAEILDSVGAESLSKLGNINAHFRNVQYIRTGAGRDEVIFWVYCMDMENLKSFYFIGSNLSQNILDRLMNINGFKCGLKITENGIKIIVWYNPNNLIAVVAEYDEFRYNYSTYELTKPINVIYKKFEYRFKIKTNFTGNIFGGLTFQTIPVRDEDDMLRTEYWDAAEVLKTFLELEVDFDEDELLSNAIYNNTNMDNFREMMLKLFNYKNLNSLLQIGSA